MPKQPRLITFVLCVFGIASVYMICQAQTPETVKADPDVPPSLFTAGPVEPLRNMVGNVEVHLLRSSNDRDETVGGTLIGLDGNWVVIRVDHMEDERKGADFQWIPVSNIERMIQTTVHPERQAHSTNQPING